MLLPDSLLVAAPWLNPTNRPGNRASLVPAIDASAKVGVRTGLLVGLGLLLFAAAWLLDLSLTSLSPPTDNIEQLTWVRAISWGYYKHPPFPTWFFWLPVQLFGPTAWASYATAVFVNLLTLAIFWRLLTRLRGTHFATLALMAVLCVSYYNDRLVCYNHNTMLMLLSTASAALCWQAFATRRLRWWTALGVVLGLGMLTKYQIAVTMASVLAFWLSQGGWRDPLHRRGLLLAALIALVLFAPHLRWLQSHDFGPIGYALESSLGARLGPLERVLDVTNWLADQLLNRALAAWLLLACVARLAPRTGELRPPAVPAQTTAAGEGAARALLLSWGLVPMLFMPMVGLVAGSRLHMQWGTPFLLFAVPAAMELLRERVLWARAPLPGAARAFLGLQTLLLLLSHLTSPHGPAALRDQHWRGFDSHQLLQNLDPALRRALAGRPVCVVSGPGAIAGALALLLPERPLVLIDGRVDQSPWVGPVRTSACSVLELRQVEQSAPGWQPVPGFAGLWWHLAPPDIPA
jgi:4-amino-4-deoxy-L-arabinose transferase-like glycosyltransferase